LKNRISLKPAAYKSNTTNQTLPVQVSSANRVFTSAPLNSGEMENRGIEVDATVTVPANQRTGIKWDVGEAMQ